MFNDLTAIHGGYKKDFELVGARRIRVSQSPGRHEWPEVGATDADVDDGFYGAAGITAPLPGVNTIDDLFHAPKRVMNVGDDIFTVDH